MRLSATVLIVEDDDALRRLLEHALVFEGFRVLTASHGGEALRVLNQELPSLVILDLVLPWVNGLEVLTTIRETPRLRSVPVLIVTGTSTYPRDVQHLQPVAVLHKPVSVEMLTPLIHRMLATT
jgi:DNA-binding response OmpR family regulator